MGIRAGWITLVKPLKRVSAARLQSIDVQIDQSGQIVIKCKHASENARLHYEVQVCATCVWQMDFALHFVPQPFVLKDHPSHLMSLCASTYGIWHRCTSSFQRLCMPLSCIPFNTFGNPSGTLSQTRAFSQMLQLPYSYAPGSEQHFTASLSPAAPLDTQTA